jgi:polyhydroxyalkanoate synthesis repressor PhaR
MTKSEVPITIKKYANRRLYNTGTSTYVTLEDLATMVKDGDDFVVFDAKTGEDITRAVLAQIIFEQENKEGGQNFFRSIFCDSSSVSTATACRCWFRAISRSRWNR